MCVWPIFWLMPNTVSGALQNASFRGKSNIPGLFYLFYLFTRLNAHISEIAKCFGTPVGFIGTRSLSEPRVQLAGSGHTTSATRELRTTMSMSRSSRAAAGLFRRLAVTPGARLGAASPAAWSQVRARVRSFKRSALSDDDAHPNSKRPSHAPTRRSRPWPRWPTAPPTSAFARSSTPDSPREPSAPSRSRPSGPSTGNPPTQDNSPRHLSARRGHGFLQVSPDLHAPPAPRLTYHPDDRCS